MCGIAGVVNLKAPTAIEPAIVERMANALFHRGPDEDGYLQAPGLSLASRRLSIVGLQDGRQPIFNEDRRVAVVFNGELFDYQEMRRDLEAHGHVFRTHCDTEIIPHLYEDHGQAMLERLRGQFALAVPCTGRGKRTSAGTGSCSPRRSRRCWLPVWCRRGPIRAASITPSPSSRCRDP
jgi:asparagine synthase (glutamine-hydrolysing)